MVAQAVEQAQGAGRIRAVEANSAAFGNSGLFGRVSPAARDLHITSRRYFLTVVPSGRYYSERMMKLSRASLYALHGMAYLAGHASRNYVSLATIRKELGLPEKHLAKIFQSLARSGLLNSLRGVNGGFALARPAAEITLLEIIKTIDGLPRGDCPVHPDAREPNRCCAVNRLVFDYRERIFDQLRRTSLADVVRRARGDPRQSGSLPPA